MTHSYFRYIKHWICCGLLTIGGGTLMAQEQKPVIRLADEAYARQEFALAGNLYTRLVKKDPSRAKMDLLMKIAQCRRETGHFAEAANWYAVAAQRPDCPAGAYFAYGEVLRNLQSYDSAKVQYHRFQTTQPDSLALKVAALQGCDSALIWQQQKPELKNLGALRELNTPYSEWISGAMKKGLLLVSNGYRKMLLNDGAEANPVTDKRTFQPHYKAYVYQQYTQGNATMYLEEMLPQVLGKYDYHIGPACFNTGEDTLYVTVNEQGSPELERKKGPVQGRRRLLLYYAVKNDKGWSPLTELSSLNVNGYSSSHPVLSRDGSVLYFVSDRPGGKGQGDIWYSEKRADGTWGEPVNCGAPLNTAASETFPTINEEGALYFSSQGHGGMGGYDIYRAAGSRSNWETPVNMRPPFNTGADDMGLILKPNGYEGYFASNRPGGQGADDVYHFLDAAYFTGGQPSGVTPGKPETGTTGGITGPGTDLAGGKPKPSGGKTLTPEELELVKELEKLRFLYDFNSAVLLPESRRTLDYVYGILKQHPDWKLLIMSYADSRGTDEYNMDLSAVRCFAVIDYLAGKGIDIKRMYYLNRGEQMLVNPCKDGVPCSEEQQRQNRRSELKIIY